jgi:hypothetical protein
MPSVFSLMRWMTHLNVGAFFATLAWLFWMHNMLSAASPSLTASAAPLTLTACPAPGNCAGPEVRR